MTIKTNPKMINVPIQDLEALKLRLSTGAPLAETDTTIILSILNVYQWMQVQLGSAKLTLHQLTKMLGFNTEKKKKSSKNGTNDNKSSKTSTEDESSLAQLPEQDSIIDGEEPPEKKS
jgi:hypothetical protein